MALPNLANGVKVAVVGSKDEQQVVNTLFFTIGTPSPSLEALQFIANGVMKWMEEEMLPLLSQDYRILYTEARSLATPIGPITFGFPLGTGVGGVGTASEPNNVTIATSFRTDLAGRSFRGRNFWPAVLSASVVDQNEMLLISSAAILGGYAALHAIIDDAYEGTRHVIVSYFINKVLRETPLATAVASYLHADLTLDSMRKRLPGRGI